MEVNQTAKHVRCKTVCAAPKQQGTLSVPHVTTGMHNSPFFFVKVQRRGLQANVRTTRFLSSALCPGPIHMLVVSTSVVQVVLHSLYQQSSFIAFVRYLVVK